MSYLTRISFVVAEDEQPLLLDIESLTALLFVRQTIILDPRVP